MTVVPFAVYLGVLSDQDRYEFLWDHPLTTGLTLFLGVVLLLPLLRMLAHNRRTLRSLEGLAHSDIPEGERNERGRLLLERFKFTHQQFGRLWIPLLAVAMIGLMVSVHFLQEAPFENAQSYLKLGIRIGLGSLTIGLVLAYRWLEFRRLERLIENPQLVYQHF